MTDSGTAGGRAGVVQGWGGTVATLLHPEVAQAMPVMRCDAMRSNVPAGHGPRVTAPAAEVDDMRVQEIGRCVKETPRVSNPSVVVDSGRRVRRSPAPASKVFSEQRKAVPGFDGQATAHPSACRCDDRPLTVSRAEASQLAHTMAARSLVGTGSGAWRSWVVLGIGRMGGWFWW